MRILAIAVAVLFLVPTVSFGQSLGEAAERERKRKAAAGTAKKAPVKVITEDELRGGRGGTYSVPDAGSSAAESTPKADAPKNADGTDAKPATAAAPKEKTEEELKAEAQKAWRDRLTQAQSEVTRLQGVVDNLQIQLNDMSQPMYGGARSSQLAAMDQAKASLAAARQAVETLTEEGRRASYR